MPVRCAPASRKLDSIRRMAAVLMFVSLASCSGPPDQTVRHQQTNFEPGKCFGLDVHYSFIADHSEKSFYGPTRIAIPFNFANSFDFDLSKTNGSRTTYAKVVPVPGNTALQILFFSADGALVHQVEFPGGIIKCDSNKTTVSVTEFVKIPWPGVDRRITVTFSSLGKRTQLETNVEIISRFNPFNEENVYRQHRAEFSRYE
jgi:hypothetical protein